MFALTYLQENDIHVLQKGDRITLTFGTSKFHTQMTPTGIAPIASFLPWQAPPAMHVNRKIAIANQMQILGHRTSYNAAHLIASFI